MVEKSTTLQKCLAEFLGTFMLVWIGSGAAITTGLVLRQFGIGFAMAPVIAIGISLGTAWAGAIYVAGKISGGHINPAVTIALAATGRFPWAEVVPYIIAQLVGAVVASVLSVVCMGTQAASSFDLGGTVLNDPVGVTLVTGCISEIIGTFLLMITIMGTVVDQRVPSGRAGWIIGMVVVGVFITLSPLTGASLNPARTFGPYIGTLIFGGKHPWNQLIVVYTIGPIVGAVLAAFFYNFMAGTRSKRA